MAGFLLFVFDVGGVLESLARRPEERPEESDDKHDDQNINQNSKQLNLDATRYSEQFRTSILNSIALGARFLAAGFGPIYKKKLCVNVHKVNSFIRILHAASGPSLCDVP